MNKSKSIHFQGLFFVFCLLALSSSARATQGLCGAFHDPAGTSPQAFDPSDVVLYRTDPSINFDWSTGGPGFPVPVDGFQTRWTGTITASFNQTYNFYVTSDDGVRLWINGILVVDNWTLHAVTQDIGTLFMSAGVPVPIVLEHYEQTGFAVIQLEWSSASTTRQVIPQSAFNTSPCIAPTFTVSPSLTPTSTVSPTPTQTPTASPTATITPTSTITPTFTVSPTITQTHTISPTYTITLTATATPEFKPKTPIDIQAVYPNPSEGPLNIYFLLEQDARVDYAIYSVSGELVYQGRVAAYYGKNLLRWEGANLAGRPVASGIYLVRLEAAMPGGVSDAWARLAIFN